MIIPAVYFFFPGKVNLAYAALSYVYSCCDFRNGWKITGRYDIFPVRRHLANHFLTDMDVIFALAYNEGVSPVAVSLRKDIPLAGSPEANIILGVDSASESNSKSEKI